MRRTPVRQTADPKYNESTTLDSSMASGIASTMRSRTASYSAFGRGQINLRFTSDTGWSDEVPRGTVIRARWSLTTSGGGPGLEDFEAGARRPRRTTGKRRRPGYGMHIALSGLTLLQEDECDKDLSCQSPPSKQCGDVRVRRFRQRAVPKGRRTRPPATSATRYGRRHLLIRNRCSRRPSVHRGRRHAAR
jgi:hypothetical protein